MKKTDSVEYLNKNMTRILMAQLAEGEKGHKTPIISIMSPIDGKPPSQENNWLYDEAKASFEGVFVNSSGQIFDFIFKRQGENWSKQFNPSKRVKSNKVK